MSRVDDLSPTCNVHRLAILVGRLDEGIEITSSSSAEGRSAQSHMWPRNDHLLPVDGYDCPTSIQLLKSHM